MSNSELEGADVRHILALQHGRALRDDADAYRRYRLARAGDSGRAAPSRRPWTEGPWLAAAKRAAAVQVRPIRPADGVLLREGFARLGPESRRRRFLGPKTVLTAAEVSYLTDVDHHDHEALVALSRQDGSGVGVARYIRDLADSRMAEVAVTIADEWQLRGIGTRLMDRLRRRALAEGVTRFSALVLEENIGAQRLLHRVPGIATLVERDDDRLSYLVDLARPRLA